MTLDRQYGQFIFECDEGNSPKCLEMVETSEHDFYDAIAHLRRAGWCTIPLQQVNGPVRWIHVCPNCTRPR